MDDIPESILTWSVAYHIRVDIMPYAWPMGALSSQKGLDGWALERCQEPLPAFRYVLSAVRVGVRFRTGTVTDDDGCNALTIGSDLHHDEVFDDRTVV